MVSNCVLLSEVNAGYTKLNKHEKKGKEKKRKKRKKVGKKKEKGN